MSVSILLTICSGFFIGVFSTNTLPKQMYELDTVPKNYVQVFLNAFSLNYWAFFVMWFLGLMPFGFLLIYFIIFFKSFMLGVTLGVCLKSSAIFGTKLFVSFVFLELLIIIPTLIYLAKKSISYSLFYKTLFLNNFNNSKYFNVLIKVSAFIILYAILTCLKMTFLEVK